MGDLKKESKVKRLKRQLSHESSNDERKKFCLSLDLSGTCDKLGQIGLSSDSSLDSHLRSDESS